MKNLERFSSQTLLKTQLSNISDGICSTVYEESTTDIINCQNTKIYRECRSTVLIRLEVEQEGYIVSE